MIVCMNKMTCKVSYCVSTFLCSTMLLSSFPPSMVNLFFLCTLLCVMTPRTELIFYCKATLLFPTSFTSILRNKTRRDSPHSCISVSSDVSGTAKTRSNSLFSHHILLIILLYDIPSGS